MPKIRRDMRLGTICTVSPVGVAACVLPRSAPSRKTANLLEWPSVSKFPFRRPVLYGSLSELRNFAHRIRSLRKQGDTHPLEIGSLYQPSFDAQHLLLNTRT